MAYERYPHTLLFTTADGESTFDENGYPIPGTAGQTLSQPCRFDAVNAVGNVTVTGVDNDTYRQAGTIYLPVTATALPERGMAVEVPGMFTGTVAATYRGQLHISIKVY